MINIYQGFYLFHVLVATFMIFVSISSIIIIVYILEEEIFTEIWYNHFVRLVY